MSKNKRPPWSYDWNHNGEYDFFDKATDYYVYDHVTHPEKYENEQSTVTRKHAKSSVNKRNEAHHASSSEHSTNPLEAILFLACPFVAIWISMKIVLLILHVVEFGMFFSIVLFFIIGFIFWYVLTQLVFKFAKWFGLDD